MNNKPNLFSQMYLVPKYLYQHLKNTLDKEQSKQIDNLNSFTAQEETKNMNEDSVLNKTENDINFSNSQIDLVSDLSEKEKNVDTKKRKSGWLTCKICGVKKNGEKQMNEHLLTAHSETLKNEKNSTPSKQSKLKKINKEIESISPIKKQKLNKSKSNFMLYN